jgi:hypothetical protein
MAQAHGYCSSHCDETHIRELRIINSLSRGHASIGGSVFAMFHLDYLSCFLTVLATILLARKSWIGLLIAIVNSVIVCAIALRTSQLGFIPANLLCICIYAFNIRSWLKEQTHTHRDQAQPQNSGSVADGPRMSSAMQHRTAAVTATEDAHVSDRNAENRYPIGSELQMGSLS